MHVAVNSHALPIYKKNRIASLLCIFEKTIVYSTYLWRLLITFANRLEPNQAWQNVGPDLDPNCLTLMVFLKGLFKKVDFLKNQQTTKKKNMKNYPVSKELRKIHPYPYYNPYHGS